jgi:hypothetical protein
VTEPFAARKGARTEMPRRTSVRLRYHALEVQPETQPEMQSKMQPELRGVPRQGRTTRSSACTTSWGSESGRSEVRLPTTPRSSFAE